MTTKTKLVYKDMVLPFVLLVSCFAAWGVAANLTDPLVSVFSRIFSMSALQSAFVQFSYYGAYFLLALPAAFVNRRFNYKTGVLLGLGLAAVGAFMFYPASIAMTYGYFLAALFVLAAGLSVLETSANPFVIAMGPEENATRRLNLAQAFNPVGTNIGVLLAATLILPHLNSADEAERAAMSADRLQSVQSAELSAVMTPYVSMALVLVAIWIGIAVSRMPTINERSATGLEDVHFLATMKRLVRNRRYSFGVAAQFFNVAAQTCTWTFTIQYAVAAIDVNEATAGDYLQASLVVFLVFRFIMTWLLGFLRPAGLLAGMAFFGVALCFYAMAAPNLSGLIAVVSLSACLSLMFPTIYGLSLAGLGSDTKFGAAGLVMAILGGALMPLVHGAVMDATSAAFAYIVPAACYLIVGLYGLYDLAGRAPGPAELEGESAT